MRVLENSEVTLGSFFQGWLHLPEGGGSKDLPSIKSPSRPSALLLFSDLPQTKILILSVKFKFGHCANKPHDAVEISWTDSGKSLAGSPVSCFCSEPFSSLSCVSVLLSFHGVLADVSWTVLRERLTHRADCHPLTFVKGEGNCGILTSREHANHVTVL